MAVLRPHLRISIATCFFPHFFFATSLYVLFLWVHGGKRKDTQEQQGVRERTRDKNKANVREIVRGVIAAVAEIQL